MTIQHSLFDLSEEPTPENVETDDIGKVVNVASVPMRSPFRYAGGKTWLVPYARLWLKERGGPEKELIEPFAGGGTISLTAIFEQFVKQVTLVELDEDVAAVWQVITSGDGKWLADRIINFELTAENARAAIAQANQSVQARAFATIVKNRVNRGGILAEGASFIKLGENGKGIQSRWYPATLKRRIMAIDQRRAKINFMHGNAFEILLINQARPDALYFIDPPYVKAGGRLYRHATIDHLALFDQAVRLVGDFLMTYDDHPEIQELAKGYGFDTHLVPMKNTHHVQKNELLIGRDLRWLKL